MTAADDDAADIKAELAAVEKLLLEKNAAYGSSWSRPLRILSKASTTEQLRVRIDDKLSRLVRGQAAGEDVVLDLLGYLLLLRIAERRAAAQQSAPQPTRVRLCEDIPGGPEGCHLPWGHSGPCALPYATERSKCPHGFYGAECCRLCAEAAAGEQRCKHSLPLGGCAECSP